VTPAASFHRLAEEELLGAIAFYDSQAAGLGTRFLEEVERGTRAILEYPEAAQEVRRGIRRRLIHGFPYALLYSQRPGGIRVLAVMNLWRHPAYWVGRK